MLPIPTSDIEKQNDLSWIRIEHGSSSKEEHFTQGRAGESCRLPYVFEQDDMPRKKVLEDVERGWV